LLDFSSVQDLVIFRSRVFKNLTHVYVPHCKTVSSVVDCFVFRKITNVILWSFFRFTNMFSFVLHLTYFRLSFDVLVSDCQDSV